MTVLLVVDTETTGLDPDRHLVWQVGAVEIDLVSKRARSHEFDLPYSRDEYPEDAYRLGHTYKTLKPTLDRIYREVSVVLEGLDSSRDEFLDTLNERYEEQRNEAISEFSTLYEMADVIVAHNADFDRPFVENQLLDQFTDAVKPWDCTLRLFQQRFPGRKARLNQACHHFGMNWDVMLEHTALYDAQMCARLLFKLQRIEGIKIE